jgi:hypothetical protein
MAITKRPKNSATRTTSPDEQERRIETFISGTDPEEEAQLASQTYTGRARVMMRFDPELLARIDTAAKRRGVSRTAWLHMIASRALDNGDG